MVQGRAGFAQYNRSLLRCFSDILEHQRVVGHSGYGPEIDRVPTRPPHASSGICGKLMNFYFSDMGEQGDFGLGWVAWVQNDQGGVLHTLR